jgi:hypothetical protein
LPERARPALTAIVLAVRRLGPVTRNPFHVLGSASLAGFEVFIEDMLLDSVGNLYGTTYVGGANTSRVSRDRVVALRGGHMYSVRYLKIDTGDSETKRG